VPIQEVEFPTITFCSSGTSEIRAQAYLINLFYEFVKNNFGIKVDLLPLAIAQLLNKVKIA
jgi:hypothetical protein